MKKYLDLISARTKIKCVGVISLAIISSVLASVWPVKLGELYTDISNGLIGSVSHGAVDLATFGLIYLFAECFTIVRRVLLDCIIATHEAEIRENSIEKLLKMPVKYTHGCLSGEKTAQINQGVAGLSQLIKIICNDVFATILTAVCTLVQVILNAPNMIALVMLVYLAITIIISMNQIKSQNGIRENIIKQKNSLDGEICQSILNLEMIRCLSAEAYEKFRLRPVIMKIRETEKKHHYYMGIFDCVKQACKIGFQILLLFISIIMISRKQMSAGAVITVCLLFQQLVKPIDDVYRFMDETASSVVKAKVLVDIDQNVVDPVYEIKTTERDIVDEDIILDNVSITTPDGKKVLAKYGNIRIPHGKRVALVGSNGCGKTTLVRGLNRYYPCSEGSITLFGKKQSEYSQKDLTNMIYYSPQVSFFVSGTIRDNLIYGLERVISDSELLKVLSKMHLYGNYEGVITKNANDVLDYKVSEGAKELSGGMKQRLALSRAFLHTPKMFIFDEITANLDERATHMVLDSIEAYAKEIGAGIVYISHESSVVDRCDEVIELVNLVKTQKKKEQQVA